MSVISEIELVLAEAEPNFINEEFYADAIMPDQLDTLLAGAWRHFGTQFFRYSFGFYELDIRLVIPLRIRLDKFSFSKSQRRVLSRNADTTVEIRPIEITDESIALFERHKQRFKVGVPDSLYDFLSGSPAQVPCQAYGVGVRLDGRLIAESYFDIGTRSVSALYAVFDPDLPRRSLGIFTMLKEIEFAVEQGKELYYQGYSYEGSSFYNYKKRFRGTEAFDWKGNWKAFSSDDIT